MVPELREEILLAFKDIINLVFTISLRQNLTSETSLHNRGENLDFRREGALPDSTLHYSPEERSYLIVCFADVYQHLYPLNASLEVKKV